MSQPIIGVIGGSGLYEIEGLTRLKQIILETPFGAPSDAYVTGELDNRTVVFLPRHGCGHRILPGEVNYRANIYGFKQLGVEYLISISAVGSMREEIHPGDVVVVDQLVDRTKNRADSFFGNGIAGHISFADPLCNELSKILIKVAKKSGTHVHEGGTYICIEGPQFSTKAESKIYRSWGVDVIGMTSIPEAKLAREAGICYAILAMATDYDCWHESEEIVSVEAIIEVLQNNVALARKMIREAILHIPSNRTCQCKEAIKNAVITDRSALNPSILKRLSLILGKE